jgi:hypothetical protein
MDAVKITNAEATRQKDDIITKEKEKAAGESEHADIHMAAGGEHIKAGKGMEEMKTLESTGAKVCKAGKSCKGCSVCQAGEAEAKVCKAGKACKGCDVCQAGDAAKIKKAGVGSIRVLDVTGAPTLTINAEDMATKNIGWLRHALEEKCPPVKIASSKEGKGKAKDAETKLVMYAEFGIWLDDDEMMLKDIKGDIDALHWMRCHAHGDEPFNINLRLMPAVEKEKILTMMVLDSDTIKLCKDKIAAEHKIAAANQRLLFGGVLLDDHRTIQSYNIPAEVTLELDIISV